MSDPASASPRPEHGHPAVEALERREIEIREKEAKVKDAELEVRRVEAEAAKLSSLAPWWRSANPLVIAVIVGAFSLGANALVAYYNGYTTRIQEQLRAENALDVEKQKSKTSLILQAISTNDASKAYNNIEFFIAADILSDTDHKIRDAAARYAPSLPSAGNIPSTAVDLVSEVEGFQPRPVMDAAGDFVIGFGHTKGVGPDTPPITLEQAKALLADDLKTANDAITRLVKVPLTTNQRSALIDLVWLIGAEHFERTDLLRVLNLGHYDEVPNEFRKWVKARVNGQTVDVLGLVKQRERDVEVWNGPESTKR